jgi:hypothetical protein
MRIDELNNKDPAMGSWHAVWQVQAFLKKAGYKRLGKGLYSEAWAQPGDDSIIKISTQEDACWLRYAKWVMKQPANPHLPRITSLRTYKTPNGTLFVARVEKLAEVAHYFEKIEKQIGREKDPKKVGEMLWVGMLAYDELSHLLDSSNIVRSLARSNIVTLPQFTAMSTREIIARLLQSARQTKLAQTVRQAHNYILKNTMCFADLHAGNVMMRGDTIVIMDPAAMYLKGSY